MPTNFNDSTPAAAGGRTNVTWQKDGSGNVSASIATPTTGTVTSVAVTVPAELSVSGSPVTSSGTIAITKANESANTVWAGPTTGGAAQPTFRALVAADIPSGVVPNFADDETPSGSVNSSNVTFTLAHTPNPSASLMLFQNGVLAIQGTDYTLSTATITMSSAPTTGAILRVFYRY